MQVNPGAVERGLALDDLPHSFCPCHGFPRPALDAERPGGCVARRERLFVSLVDAILRHGLALSRKDTSLAHELTTTRTSPPRGPGGRAPRNPRRRDEAQRQRRSAASARASTCPGWA